MVVFRKREVFTENVVLQPEDSLIHLIYIRGLTPVP